jgi:hypothetical protein
VDIKLLSAAVKIGADRSRLERIFLNGYGEVMQKKEDLPAQLPGITSLRDYGGCYLVHGRYLLHATVTCRLAYASMVDVNPLPEFAAAIERVRAQLPQTEFETVGGDFREPALFQGLRETDASLLYEVILHQENYVEVIRNVCAKTRKFICFAQPCLAEEFFTLPASAVLLQFHSEALKDVLRTNSFWPKEPPVERFNSAHWMWGHTVSHILDVFKGLGWMLRHGVLIGGVCGPCWDYPLLVFERVV